MYTTDSVVYNQVNQYELLCEAARMQVQYLCLAYA